MSQAKQRVGRPSYNLAEAGHLVPCQKVVDELQTGANGESSAAQVVYNGWRCTYCDWDHFLKNGNVNTTRALDHLLLKCQGIPDDQRLLLYNGGTIKKRIPSDAVQAQLTGLTATLAEDATPPATKRPRGRPKGSTNKMNKRSAPDTSSEALAVASPPAALPLTTPKTTPATDPTSQNQAGGTNSSVCAFLVAYGLPFSTVRSPAFSRMASAIRGSTATQLPPPSWLATSGIKMLHMETRTKVEKRFATGGLGSALTLQGRTLAAGELQVLQFCEQQGKRFAYRDTVLRGSVPGQVQRQLEGRSSDRWCAVVLDCNESLEETRALMEASHKTVLCYSCASEALGGLLSTCLRMAQESLSAARLVAGLVVDQPAVSAMLKETAEGPVKIKCMSFGRSLQAAEMLQSLMASQGAFEATLAQGLWQEHILATEDPNLPRVVELIESQEFWPDLASSSALLSPVSAAAKVMASDSARISFVYSLFHSLEKDISSWAATSGGRGTMALAAFTDVWTGGHQLYQPVHLAAYLLDPYLAFDCHKMPPGGPRIVRSVLRLFCSSDLDTNELMEAFYAFHSRGEAFDEAMDEAQSHVTIKFDALKEQLGPGGAALTFTETAALRCQAAGDPIAWWKIHGGVNPRLRDAAIRVLSCCPVTCVPRAQAMLEEAVGAAGGAALNIPEVKRLLYCHTNQQALSEGPAMVLTSEPVTAAAATASLAEEVLSAAHPTSATEA